MVMVKDLTQLTLEDLWKEVKDEDEWWGEINERTLYMVKLILESSLEEELLEELQAARYRRSRVRKGYRNGHYERSLYTTFGVIKSLKVPRARESYSSKILSRYQRRQQEINTMIRGMFLAGVSTRRVGEILTKTKGENVSAQTVSRIARSLDMEVAFFHSRPLADSYRYLFFDGISLKVKGAGKVHRRQVLCAYGVTWEGKREIISFRQAADESEAKWEAFLRDLYNRGLEGKNCRLIVTDGCPGLHKALEMVYPYTARQRCWVHKLRNVSNKLRRKDREECLAGAKLIYLAQHREEAIRNYKEWKMKWQSLYPRAVSCLEKDLDELLSFFNVPSNHRIKVRTTNVIERAFKEVRRRIRPMSCFTNPQSVDRIIYGVTNHLNQSWKEKPLVEFTQQN
ncbi:MAG: IS256 family transposase [Thermoproteota archaeon]